MNIKERILELQPEIVSRDLPGSPVIASEFDRTHRVSLL